MIGRRPWTLLAALESALRADLVVDEGDRLAFRAGLLRRAVLETLPRPLRRGLEHAATRVMLDGRAALRDDNTVAGAA